jgi:hypothetical protein
MAPVRALDGSFTILGNRLPRIVGLLIGATLVASVCAAVGYRNGVPFILREATLSPALVWQGQIWRLVTWIFIEIQGIPPGTNLFFGGMVLFFIGPDLYYGWGATRFLGHYIGIAAASGLATCVVGRFWPEVWAGDYFTMWPAVDAMLIAWAALHPSREIRLFLVLPARGRSLIIAIMGLTLLFALINGISGFIPHFLAEGLMLGWMNPPRGLQQFWHRARLRRMSKRPTKFRVVEREEPPRWLH